LILFFDLLIDLVSTTNELIERVSIDNIGHIDWKIESIEI